MLTVPILILHLLFNVNGIVRRDVALQITGQLFDRDLQVGLVVLEYDRVVVLLQVEGKCIRVHESLTAEAQNVDGLAKELDFDPGHVVLLHLFHLLADCVVQLLLEF